MKAKLLVRGLVIFTANLPAQGLVADFVNCDKTFFATLSAQQLQLQPYVAVDQIDNDYAYIRVPNRTDKRGKYITFKQPIRDQGLTLEGYIDEVLKIGSFGDYYTWGFIIDEPVSEVVAQLSQIKWQAANQGSYYANSKIIHKKAKIVWQNDPNQQTGTIPRVGTAEKVLLIDSWQNKTLLTCSIQGSVTQQILALDRPDL